MPDIGQSQIITTNGTYVHQANTTEQEVLALTDHSDHSHISYDMSLLLQDTTIRVYEEVDGTNEKLLIESVFPTDFDPSQDMIELELTGKDRDMRITFKSGTSEAGTINVPFARRDES